MYYVFTLFQKPVFPPTMLFILIYFHILGFPGGVVVKNPPANAGDARDVGSVPELERSPGGGNDNPLQYACLDSHHGHCYVLVQITIITRMDGPFLCPTNLLFWVSNLPSILVVHCCMTSYPKSRGLIWQVVSHCFWGQESRHGLAMSSD